VVLVFLLLILGFSHFITFSFHLPLVDNLYVIPAILHNMFLFRYDSTSLRKLHLHLELLVLQLGKLLASSTLHSTNFCCSLQLVHLHLTDLVTLSLGVRLLYQKVVEQVLVVHVII